jgi:hypothetical protein
MKVIQFVSTFGSLAGCKHKDNDNKIAIIEIIAPHNIEELEKEPYKLTVYIEKLTGLFVLNQRVIEKEQDFFD